ncbi:MAG: dTMP kinase [Candidatus Saccharimonadales bacterium]
MSQPGKYIVIEGPEGVGKTTQIGLLAQALGQIHLPVRVLREPDSQSDVTARAIRRLTQDPQFPMNTRTEVLLYNAARAQSLAGIHSAVQNGIYCLVDRNYLTTLAVQYYGRGDVPEYDKINAIIDFAVGDMEPDLTIVLDAEVATLKQRVQNRYQGERFDNLDEAFLERVRAGYLWEARQRNLPVVYALETPEKVFQSVWELVAKTLKQRYSNKSAAGALQPQSVAEIIAENQPASQISDGSNDQPLVTKLKSGHYQITPAGQDFLDSAVTESQGNVYAFSDKLSPVTIAAAMARLSRRGDDMRITILDEFAGKLDKDAQLLHRVISAYGDDSVQQLAGLHIVVENASQLLTKKLEWGRLASYLEQSTRYIYFDKKDYDGQYKYFAPDYFDAKTKKRYISDIDKIFDLYSTVVHKLTECIQKNSKVAKKDQDGAWRAATRAQACDAARPMLPVATKSTVGIFASGQALESLIMHLLADELPEARATGQQILDESRKVMPAFLERADKPDRGGAMIAYRANTHTNFQKLADSLCSQTASDPPPSVSLTDYWPKNELDLVPDMLYEFSAASVKELRAETAKWSYDQKQQAFTAYMGERLNRRHRPGRALEKAHYSFDILCDYGIFRDLQRHRMVDDLAWQKLTPRYGYDVPKLVDQAGLTDEFEQAFDISLGLYSFLQAKHPLEAQYATLLGHKLRWKITYNARQAFHLHEIRTSPQGHPGYRKLVLEMHAKLAEVHPQMAAAMKFVNQGEDPELTRLAAERYSQFKGAKLN